MDQKTFKNNCDEQQIFNHNKKVFNYEDIQKFSYNNKIKSNNKDITFYCSQTISPIYFNQD